MNDNATAAQLGSVLGAETKSVLTDEVAQTKLVASLVLFIITLLCGYLPVRMILNQNYIQHAMFAGGGVLMATAFCHLIPEAHDSYKMLNLSNHTHLHQHQHQHNLVANINIDEADNYLQHQHQDETVISVLIARINGLNVPYLEMTLCFGFFFMYLCEQIMLKFINSHTHEHPCDTSTGQLIIGQPQQPPTNESQQQQQQQQHNQHHQHHQHHNYQQQQIPAFTTDGSASVGNLSTSITGSSTGRQTGATELYKFIRGLLIVSAFGMHSIFDGVAIGSQETVEKVWTIFAAISCHKLIIVAVVGLELFAATLESHLWTIVHLTIFSIMSPIGIILVVVAQNSLNIDSNHPSMILLQSFATGTLLYIIFVEILQPKEGHLHSKNRIWKSVNGSSLDCHFNELTIDDRHVKYQSACNTSLYLGFDKLGNSICGRSSNEIPPNQHSTTPTPLRQTGHQTNEEYRDQVDGCERCYLFTKINRLATSTQYYPDALKMSGADQARNQADDSEREPATRSSRIGSGLAGRVYDAAEEAAAAKRRLSATPLVERRSFRQRQLINMVRYRNILRYQLGRRAGQSIVPGELEQQQATGAGNKFNGNKSRAGGRRRQKVASNLSGKNKTRRQASERFMGSLDDETTCEDDDSMFE